MKGLGLGCLNSPKDERNYQFKHLVAGVDKMVLPEEYIPEFKVEVFDQGDTSMCCACATAMSRYIYELGDSGNSEQMSPMYIYGNRAESTVEDGIYEGEGMYLRDALKQLTKMGDCKYDTLPGFGTYEDCHDTYLAFSTKANTEAYPFRVSSYYEVTTEKQIKKAILETGSVLAAFEVTTGWYYTKSDGIISTKGEVEGGHAVLIVGWKLINGKLHWIILNSWGDSWGDHGFGYIEPTDYLSEAYCILDDVHEADLRGQNGKAVQAS